MQSFEEAHVLEAVGKLALEHELDLVLVFGSRTTGKTHERSDIDVGIRRKQGLVRFERLIDLGAELDALLAAGVDLVDIRAGDPLLLKKIFEHPIVLFAAPGAFDEARLHAFHRYQDYRPFLELERRAVRRKLGLDAG